ncbi:MAG: sigma-E processing peptidase SpoIIGA [Bacillota bacterium]|jgi:stage II sporulation protein GA (sporulation sigma-E factor processing peptidase)
MKSCVYLDVLFAVNLVVNYVMLLAAGKMMGLVAHTRRIASASCLGGLYSVLALVLPFQSFFSLPARVLFGLLMVALSYPKARDWSFVGLAGSFYLCAALVAGTSMGLHAWGGLNSLRSSLSWPVYPGAHWWTLALSLSIVCFSGFLWRVFGLRTVRPLPLMQAELTVDGHCIMLTCLVDTGNDLRDPVSGLPVIVVDWDSLRSIMPEEVSSFFLSTWDSVSARLTETNIGKRLRLIPYANVCGRRGVLPGFKPDGLVLVEKNGNKVRKDAVVGVSENRLSPQGLYQALLHPELVSI